MIVESVRLGPLQCDESSLLHFPQGLLGFEDVTRFAVIEADETGAYCWLQSVDDPALAFLSVVPGFFFDDYAPEIPDGDAAELGVSDVSHTQILALVTISDDGITANLLGPVVVNLRTRTARQIVLSDQGWTVREPLGGA